TKNGPDTTDVVIHSGESAAFSYLLRFGSTVDTALTLAPDAYASFLASMPNLVNWPDRRPIAYWTISEGTRRSLTNPRGYLWDPTLDTSTAAFSTAVLGTTDSIIASFNQLAVRPQGIIIWDLEGQEFVHTFTYVGNPPSLLAIAPDMNAVADQMFAKFI